MLALLALSDKERIKWFRDYEYPIWNETLPTLLSLMI
jgi:hypothetical protein